MGSIEQIAKHQHATEPAQIAESIHGTRDGTCTMLSQVDAQCPRRWKHEVEDAETERQENEDCQFARDEGCQYHADGRNCETYGTQRLATNFDAIFGCELVGEITTRNVAAHAHEERDGHSILQLLGRESASRLHKFGKPGEEEPGTECIEEIHGTKHPELPVSEDDAPGYFDRCLLGDFLFSRFGSLWFLVTIVEKPDDRPNNSNSTQQIE